MSNLLTDVRYELQKNSNLYAQLKQHLEYLLIQKGEGIERSINELRGTAYRVYKDVKKVRDYLDDNREIFQNFAEYYSLIENVNLLEKYIFQLIKEAVVYEPIEYRHPDPDLPHQAHPVTKRSLFSWLNPYNWR